MLVALTGASGFIGSYTAAALHKQGHRVRALVRKSSRRDHIAPHVAEWVEGAYPDPRTQSQLVDGADAVIHNAADWAALREGPTANLEKNLLASLRLLESARTANVPQFLFVSSVAAYTDIPPSAAGRITEETATWPGSLYGAYKAAVEPFLKAYHATYNMNTSAWRPAAVYGLDPDLPRSQWHDLIKQTKDGARISTDQGGKITHVQDVADALTLAIGDPQVAGQFYNLAETYMYWQTAAEFAKELSGSNATIEDKKGHGPRNHFDTTKTIAFFDRHNHPQGLRRGPAGVRDYVRQLLPAIP